MPRTNVLIKAARQREKDSGVLTVIVRFINTAKEDAHTRTCMFFMLANCIFSRKKEYEER